MTDIFCTLIRKTINKLSRWTEQIVGLVDTATYYEGLGAFYGIKNNGQIILKPTLKSRKKGIQKKNLRLTGLYNIRIENYYQNV